MTTLYDVKAVNRKFPVGSWGFAILPSGGSEEIRIPMGQASTSRPAGYRPYSWHPERTGHSYCIHTR